MNKKGFEIAVNFIVMLILAMAVFGTGIYFAFKIFGDVIDTGDIIDQQTKDLMEKKLRDSSQLVAFGKFQQTVERGENVKFVLGISNPSDSDDSNPDSSSPDTFTITVTCVFATDKNGDEIIAFNINDCPKTKTPQTITIKPNDYGTASLLFAISKKTKVAKYSYDVIVKSSTPDETAYGGLQKLYIQVK